MPHVLYNHITHSWDQPDPDDGCSESAHHLEESPEFSPALRRALPRLALGAGTAILGFLLVGLIAGLLLGIS